MSYALISPTLLTPDQFDTLALEWRRCYTRGIIPESIRLGDVLVMIKAEERDRRRLVFGARRTAARPGRTRPVPQLPSTRLTVERVPGQWWTTK